MVIRRGKTPSRPEAGGMTFEGALAALLGMVGKEVSVMVAPDDDAYGPPIVTATRGVLSHGEATRVGPWDWCDAWGELMHFMLDEGTSSFYLSGRGFRKGRWDKGPAGTPFLRVSLARNEIWIAPDERIERYA